MNIICPVCKNVLTKYDKSYKCPNGHNFDIAKQGYLNLNMHNSQNTGDNDEMINTLKEKLGDKYVPEIDTIFANTADLIQLCKE